jgi:hypothetical protein
VAGFERNRWPDWAEWAAEERSEWSPFWKQYGWAYYLHRYFLRWVPVVAGVMAAWQAWEWLTLPVVLPLG